MKRLLLLACLLAGCSAIQPATPAANDGKLHILPLPMALDALGVSVPLQVNRGPAVWRADNDAVAKVDAAGRLTTVGNGRVTVRAERDGETSETTLEVKQTAVSLSVVPPSLTLAAPGQTQPLTVAAKDRNDRPLVGGVTFTSRDVGIATVSAEGEVRAVASGQTEVTVSVGGRQTTVRVTVAGRDTQEHVPDGPAGQAKLVIRL